MMWIHPKMVGDIKTLGTLIFYFSDYFYSLGKEDILSLSFSLVYRVSIVLSSSIPASSFLTLLLPSVKITWRESK